MSDKLTRLFNAHLVPWKDLKQNYKLCNELYNEIASHVTYKTPDSVIHELIAKKIAPYTVIAKFNRDMKDLLDD
jgi:hypothetical protein